MQHAIIWTRKSVNAKTGPIPVTTSAKATCPPSCPLKGKGCYAENSHLGVMWNRMSEHGPNASFSHGRATVRTTDWGTLCSNVAALPEAQLWRHNQAGDLPHNGGTIDRPALGQLVAANRGRRGFTYTHHKPELADNAAAIADANRDGFTVNLSADDLAHADELADRRIAPVVVVLPSSVAGPESITTPKGRRVVVCPATYREDVSCSTCKLCAVAKRETVVGFPAHGARKTTIDRAARVWFDDRHDPTREHVDHPREFRPHHHPPTEVRTMSFWRAHKPERPGLPWTVRHDGQTLATFDKAEHAKLFAAAPKLLAAARRTLCRAYEPPDQQTIDLACQGAIQAEGPDPR